MVHAGIIPAQWQSVVDELHEAQQRIRSLEGVRDKLLVLVEDMREENKKLQDIIAAHGLCHDLHGKVDACAFAAGCVAEQKKIYGHSPHETKIKQLEEENRRLRERCPMTVQEICERADAAEAAARRYQQVVEQGDGTAQEVVDGSQPGGLQPSKQGG